MEVKFAVHYKRPGNSKISENVTLENIDKTHVRMYQGIYEYYEYDSGYILEIVFMMFSGILNPLTMKRYQDFIIQNELHTTMYVGDIVELKYEQPEFWIRASKGWERLKNDI